MLLVPIGASVYGNPCVLISNHRRFQAQAAAKVGIVITCQVFSLCSVTGLLDKVWEALAFGPLLLMTSTEYVECNFRW